MQKQRSHLLFLDGLRGLSALGIVLYHAIWVLWEGFGAFRQHPDSYPLIGQIFAYILPIFYFARHVVLFFFVLSGFVIHYRYAKQLVADTLEARFDAKSYAIRRIRRIYPPLVFALLLTFVLDLVGQTSGFLVYTDPAPLGRAVESNTDFTTLIGNLLFVNTVYVESYGTNEPLWSLMREGWFYLLYPALWLLTRRAWWLATAAVVIVFVLSFIPQIWLIEVLRVVCSSLLAWWCGALLADVYVGRIKLKMWKIAPLALLCLPMAPTVFINVPEQILPLFDLAWALAFTGIIAGLLAWQRRGGQLDILEQLGTLAGLSYTLYVTHFPILVFLSGWYTLHSPNNLRPQGVEWVFIGTGICLLVAWLMHFVVEKPFTRSRKSIEAIDKAGSPASP